MKLEEIEGKTGLGRSQLQRVMAAAREASKLAHAPYSRYHVGAALLLGNGDITSGANVENASYGLTTCAERSAIVRAIAEGRQSHGFSLLAVHAYMGCRPRVSGTYSLSSPSSSPRCRPNGCGKAAPCGACRQLLVEFNPGMYVVSVTKDDEHELWTAADLLPAYFGPISLQPVGNDHH